MTSLTTFSDGQKYIWALSAIVFFGFSFIMDYFFSNNSLVYLFPLLVFTILVVVEKISTRFAIYGIEYMVGGASLTAFLVESYYQILGFWPSVFWTDLIFICLISNTYILKSDKVHFSWDLCVLVIAMT